MRILGLRLLWVVALVGCARGSAVTAKSSSDGTDPAEHRDASQQATRLSPAEIAAQATPAIVSVRTEETMGTGFVVNPDGWVATNFHVIAGGNEITVTLADKRQLKVVEIMGADLERDLVILRVEAKGLPVLRLAPAHGVHAGDSVVAIGHPLGLEDTISNGLVSAVRHVGSGLEVLQISAPIAPGSSGGPLFNDRGEVIGVAMMILRGGQNLNFGLPVEYLAKLREHPAPVDLATFRALTTRLPKAGPQVRRQIPIFDRTLLKGCSDEAIAMIPKALGAAIDVGVPLYNDGNFAACYHIYEGAAADLERRLPRACSGPKKALEAGRKRAAKLDEPTAQAWALRDTFDGLLDFLEHRDK
jgi:hypothetical protein